MSKERHHHKEKERPTDQPENVETAAGPNGEPTTVEDQLAVAEEKVKALELDVAQSKDQLLRAIADMQNLRKRFQGERESFHKLVTEQLVKELLPVLDNLERTLSAAESGASSESLLEGVKAVERQLKTILEGRKFERIKAKGSAFDPNLHEAVSTHPTPELPEGTVVEELEPGYKVGNTVIRPAKVQVSKRP